MNSKHISPSEKWSCPFYIKTLSHFCWEQLPQAVKYVPCELAFKLSHLWQCAFMESVNNFKCLQDKFKCIPFHSPLFLHSPTNYTFPFSFSWYITYLQNCLKKTLLFKHLKNVLLLSPNILIASICDISFLWYLCTISLKLSGSLNFGLPKTTPLAFAILIPSTCRCLIFSLSPHSF